MLGLNEVEKLKSGAVDQAMPVEFVA